MVDMACRQAGIDKSLACMIGDRLYTDIAAGNNAGVLSVAVLTGEATTEEIASAEGPLVPDIVCKSIDDIYYALTR